MRPPTDEPGRVGDYLLDGVVGRGSAGTVYRARRVDWHDRVVALKRVAGGDPARTARAEADVLAALDHPHIVRVLELVPDGDGLAIAMQYAPGGSLARLLGHRGRLRADEVVALAAPLADALASAHRRGVLHGDVTPANVLLTADGEPLLSDFGLARPTSAGVPASVAGTAEYLDPAVAAGAAPDERSDVYGLGAVCYEMLAGTPPYRAATLDGVLEAAAAGRLVSLGVAAPDVPAALAVAVERALARDPAQRFPDAATFAAALRAAVPPPARGGVAEAGASPDAAAGEQVPPRPTTRAFGPRPPLRRPPAPAPRARRPYPRRLVLAAGAVVLAAGAVAGVRAASDREHTVAPAAAGHEPAADAPAPPGCAPVPGALAADVNGDGCPDAVVWNGAVAVAEVAGHRYQLGRPGDVLLLGDWDCDGNATPALYRPGTGAVHLFPAWAGPDERLAAVEGRSGPPGGTARVVRDAGGCDRVEVQAASAATGPAPGP